MVITQDMSRVREGCTLKRRLSVRRSIKGGAGRAASMAQLPHKVNKLTACPSSRYGPLFILFFESSSKVRAPWVAKIARMRDWDAAVHPSACHAPDAMPRFDREA